MNRKRLVAWCFSLGLSGVLAIVGASQWRRHVIQQQEYVGYEQAIRCLKSDQPRQAIRWVQSSRLPDSRLDWNSVEMAALVAALQIPRLADIFRLDPARLLADERASLLLARAFFSGRQMRDFDRIRAHWFGREAQDKLWLVLDADVLMLSGNADEARELLNRQSYTGPAEALRLTRLSLLTAADDLYRAYEMLDEAVRLDSRNPDTRSFRGQVLEKIGKPSLARVEYVAALIADPQNPLLRDQLAEFYRRQGSYDLALETWRQSLEIMSLDFVRLKTLFWSRMITPVKTPSGSDEDRLGSLQSLVNWIHHLGPDEFWNATSFEELPLAEEYQKERQEVFWLQLLQSLKEGDATNSLQKIQFNPFKTSSWQPDLEVSLHRILSYRLHGTLNPPGLYFDHSSTNAHQFFNLLEKWARQERMTDKTGLTNSDRRFLTGPEAICAALLAAGWREAALIFVDDELSDRNPPEWLSYGLAQSLRHNRGPEVALEFLGSQPKSPMLQLLQGEILLSLGNLHRGISVLDPISSTNTAAGNRATWLLALTHLDLGEPGKARRLVQAHPFFADSTIGRELLGRIFLKEGDIANAASNYTKIAAESLEAKVFLAKQAFASGQWEEARQHTENLIALHPDVMQLRRNLTSIQRVEEGE